MLMLGYVTQRAGSAVHSLCWKWHLRMQLGFCPPPLHPRVYGTNRFLNNGPYLKKIAFCLPPPLISEVLGDTDWQKRDYDLILLWVSGSVNVSWSVEEPGEQFCFLCHEARSLTGFFPMFSPWGGQDGGRDYDGSCAVWPPDFVLCLLKILSASIGHQLSVPLSGVPSCS